MAKNKDEVNIKIYTTPKFCAKVMLRAENAKENLGEFINGKMKGLPCCFWRIRYANIRTQKPILFLLWKLVLKISKLYFYMYNYIFYSCMSTIITNAVFLLSYHK